MTKHLDVGMSDLDGKQTALAVQPLKKQFRERACARAKLNDRV
jgi:hypothetical protein